MNGFAQNGMMQEHRLQHMSKIGNCLHLVILYYKGLVAC